MKNIAFVLFLILPCLVFSQAARPWTNSTDSLNITSSKTEDLVVLGKVWGFLKYYHPSVARGNYNWDNELLRMLPEVLGADRKVERDRLLADWIAGMGELKKGRRRKEEKGVIKQRPDLGWIDSSGFSPGLVTQLSKVREAKRGDEHFYIREIPSFGSLKVQNENPYPQMEYTEMEYRLLALYRYWNLVEYFFAYKYLIEEDWDRVLQLYIPKFIAASDKQEYTLTILSLITNIHDSHAAVLANKTLESYRGRRHAALEISFIDGKAVVSGYFDQAAGMKTGLLPGDVILRVEGEPVEEKIKRMLPLSPASNEHTRYRDVAEHLLKSNNAQVQVEYARGDSIFQASIATFTRDTIPSFKPAPDTAFKFVAPGIAYLHGGKVEAADLPDIWTKFKSAKGLIIDLRCSIHPAYRFYYELARYLLPGRRNFVKASFPSISSPGLFVAGEPVQAGPRKNKDYYKGKVVILVNERTQSAAEFHTMAFVQAPQATIIGSRTAGADGNVLPFTLPGRVETSFSGVGVYYPDGSETQRIGIVPDLIVKPTIQGLRNGKDELLESAIKLISSKEFYPPGFPKRTIACPD